MYNEKKCKILFYLCGDCQKASSRVRGYWIAEELVNIGYTCDVEYRQSKLALLLFLLRIPFYDVIVFQKVYSRWHCLLQKFAKFLKKRTIFDLDDAPSRTNHPVTLTNVKNMMHNVSAVTVGGQGLYEFAKEFSANVHLIPSSIYLKYYIMDRKYEAKKPTICLGWIGNGKHYRDDLINILRPPLIQVARKQPIRFKLIGACEDRSLYQAFSGIPGLEVDFIDLVQWGDPKEVVHSLQDIDIGLYPLQENEFNRYKCGFKALEYMAIGIPVLSSHVAENMTIVEHGKNGFFAGTSLEWERRMLELIKDTALRERMGIAGRKKVEKSYSIKEAVNIFIQVFVN